MLAAELQLQLADYESQLSDIDEMLEIDPSDESILKLKTDLEELISLTISGVTAAGVITEVSDKQLNENVLSNTTSSISNNSSLVSENNSGIVLSKNNSASLLDSTEEQVDEKEEQKGANNINKSKKMKVPSEFSAPSHLTPLASDTDAEKNKKRRTLKALKSKWRERVKEISSEKKQKSWKDFSNKKRTKNAGEDSIFRTSEGVSDRVGVIGSGKAMTGYGDRKRFKL